MAADKLPNLKVLRAFRGPDGVHVEVGSIFPKDAMEKADWQTLVNMTPARLEETDESVSEGGKRKKTAAALPTA